MMVKDGGALFAQALESVKDFDAQVVVLVDNATRDNTAEIAKNFGAQVEFHDWPDDFAEARNRSLSFAERKWILVLDHDERFERADIETISKILDAEDQYTGIRITTLNETRGGGVTAHFIPRFVRNGLARYQGAKHHGLVLEGSIRYAPARLYHSGYNLSPQKMKEKNERDLKLLRKQIEEEPYNTYHRRNLIRSLRSKGDTEELLKQAEELHELVQNFKVEITDLSMQVVMLDTGSAHITEGDLDDAKIILSQLTREYPGNP
jgi:glycosyltransferase involved in cell wall biosynthesis